MENLHPDIILNIVSRLPVDSVYQCKLVCKTWRTLLRSTKVGLLFAIGPPDYNSFPGEIQLYYGDQYDEININDDQLQHYSYKTTLTKIDLQYPPIIDHRFPIESVMLGSCNGLVCFTVTHHSLQDPVYICNPITGEYVHLPRLTCGYNIVSGFGYHYFRTTNTDEYKVVRIYFKEESDSREVGHVQVYTLGDGRGWRNKGETHHFFISNSICANGVLYWMDHNDDELKIIAFDLADEEFRLLPSPPCFSLGLSLVIALTLLGGYLCVVVIGESKCSVDIWQFKKIENSSYDPKEQEYNSAHWSWSKEVSIPWEGYPWGRCHLPFARTKSNEVLLLYNGIFLSWYDPKTATVKKLWDDDDDTRRRYVHAIPHMNSLVSLKALGEKSESRR